MLSIENDTCESVDSIIKEARCIALMKFGLILSVVSVSFCPIAFGQWTSPSGDHTVFKIGSVHRDVQTIDIKYYLVRSEQSDTTLVATNLRHSEKPPIPIWTADGQFLIIENSVDADVPRSQLGDRRWHEVSSLLIWNIGKNQLEKEVQGFIMTPSNNYDIENNVLIYYAVTGKINERKSNVMALDLNTMTSKKIHELACFIRFHYPPVSLLPAEKEITIAYSCLVSGESVRYSEVISY